MTENSGSKTTVTVELADGDFVVSLLAAYKDAMSALRYIRTRYGDLYGVGWTRLDETYSKVCSDE